MGVLNKVMLIGSLVDDPVMQYSKSGRVTCRFGLEVVRCWQDKNGANIKAVSLFKLKAIGKKAEMLRDRCRKGHRLFVDGRLPAQMTMVSEIKIDGFQFLTPKI